MGRREGGPIGEEKEPQGIPRADLTHPPQNQEDTQKGSWGSPRFLSPKCSQGEMRGGKRPERAGALGKETVNKGDGKE